MPSDLSSARCQGWILTTSDHLAKVPIESIGGKLTKMRGRGEESRISKVNSPRSSEEILLLSLPRIVEDSWQVDCGGENTPVFLLSISSPITTGSEVVNDSLFGYPFK